MATKFASMTVALPVAPFVVIRSVVAVLIAVAGSLTFSALAAMISRMSASTSSFQSKVS